MALELQKIYPLTDITITGMSHAEQVELLANGGARVIQLREKKLSARDFYDQAHKALEVARLLGVQIIVNDRVDIALSLKADGVHLGQDDLPVEAARQLLGPTAIIGISTHSLEQAKRALKLPIDYLAIGPIFHTGTKADTSPEVGLEGVRSIRSLQPRVPVVAIGGITASRIPEVLQAGADSVALISALLATSRDISTLTRELLTQFV